jgi:hypothetical protein
MFPRKKCEKLKREVEKHQQDKAWKRKKCNKKREERQK